MKKRFLFAVLLLSLSIVAIAQIRSDYKKGMQIPDKINLIAVAPKGIIKLTLEKPYPNGFHTLIAKKDNAREEMDEINYSISGNYPRKLKEDYICSKLIAYGVNTAGNPSSKWRLFQINKNNGNLDIFTATPVNRSNSSNISLRSLLFDFIRSKVFTKQELEWYNQHFTKEQLDAMTRFGLGIATGGGNGQYVCRSCGATFTNSADLRSHENAYHDY